MAEIEGLFPGFAVDRGDCYLLESGALAVDKDALQYKDACERCGASLTWVSPAFVCPSECTFCPECMEELGGVCPNCSGELGKRPARTQPIGRRK